MDNNRLSFLLKRYHEGKCSEEEIGELQNWYESLYYPTDTDYAIDEAEMLAELKAMISASENKRRNIYKSVYRYAAVFVCFCLSAGLFFYTYTKKESSVKENKAVYTNLIDKKIIVLSDGSRVVLNGESQLVYPETFKGEIREVTLIGEAYFDITRDTLRPFIINTGKVRTRVLGTAFNIKATNEQKDIVVTVTRGKVQVENEKAKVLAVLTPDEQVHYDSKTETVNEKNVDVNESISWTQKNMMKFDSASFGEIANRLSRIYAVNISFSEPKLKNCLITASFSGVETLEEVLNILCRTRGTHYQIKDNNNILISGTGCNP